jgi:hypothetical protein
MTTNIAQLKEELVDREAIRECLYRYARGVDRLDAEMVRSAYWPDALDNHLEFNGSTEQFIAWAFPIMRTMDQTLHTISNILLTLRGTQADAESYYYGLHRMNGPQGKFDVIGAGRYLDKLERRDGEWRIIKRTVVVDWFRTYPDSADWANNPLGNIKPGGRFPEDLSYSFLAL